jgi:polyhydroxybutyrate depolymerase
MRARTLIVLLAAVLARPAAVSAQQDVSRSILWQGIERLYVLHTPEEGMPSRAPLVVALAGVEQNLESLRHWLPIDPVADQNGFAVVYPEAIGGKWSYWRGGGILLPGHHDEEVDDVGFIASVVETLIKDGVADPTRVYLTGVSRGALMSWTLACERADLFAAVAPLSSAMTATQKASCHPSRPLPAIAVDGTEDRAQPYDGFIYPSPAPRLISIPQTMELWWRLNGCTGESVKQLPQIPPDNRTWIELYEWTGCASGGRVKLYRVSGGGHAPPSLSLNSLPDPQSFGVRNHDIETAEEIWKAFSPIKIVRAQ